MKIVLLSTYDLGRQPFGLASPAAWLRRAGAEVSCQDLSIETLDEAPVRIAKLVAFHVPMHTATRIAVSVLDRVKAVNPAAHLCFYGLYAPVNETYLRGLGIHTILGGEFEKELVNLVRDLKSGDEDKKAQKQKRSIVSLERLQFEVPDRQGLPDLTRYAGLNSGYGDVQTTGYTEASRGCKHLCRHCPIVPVYQGAFRVVQHNVVLEDIRRQAAIGACHFTFGDPDFFNGVGHAIRLVKAFHAEHPNLTYDVTIKVEHLLKHAAHLPTLRDTGCLFVTSAVESIDNRVLKIFDKGHTYEDFVRVVHLFRKIGLHLNPTFVTFTPWTSLEGYQALVSCIIDLDLVDQISPVQLAIRLLIPTGSRLLELPEVQRILGGFDGAALSYTWHNKDPRVDKLQRTILDIIKHGEARGETRQQIFLQVWRSAYAIQGTADEDIPTVPILPSPSTIPFLTEPWYC